MTFGRLVFEATGETGETPSGTCWSLFPLMMPMTTGLLEAHSLKFQMRNDTKSGDNQENHVERIRANVDTTDHGAIMGRFYAAVSWRNN